MHIAKAISSIFYTTYNEDDEVETLADVIWHAIINEGDGCDDNRP